MSNPAFKVEIVEKDGKFISTITRGIPTNIGPCPFNEEQIKRLVATKSFDSYAEALTGAAIFALMERGKMVLMKMFSGKEILFSERVTEEGLPKIEVGQYLNSPKK